LVLCRPIDPKWYQKNAWTELFLPPGDTDYNYLHSGGSGSGDSCGMQRPGFNTQCNDNNSACIGYCGILPSQPCQSSGGSDADFAVGLGLRLQNHSGAIGEYLLSAARAALTLALGVRGGGLRGRVPS
jgi:hypothetical protein